MLAVAECRSGFRATPGPDLLQMAEIQLGDASPGTELAGIRCQNRESNPGIPLHSTHHLPPEFHLPHVLSVVSLCSPLQKANCSLLPLESPDYFLLAVPMSFSNSQVLLRHVQSSHLQLPLLVRLDDHLHHGHDPNQHLLHGLPGGLFLLPALRG